MYTTQRHTSVEEEEEGNHCTYTANDGHLEEEQHDEREECIVPVLVEQPETDAEHLKHEKWC
jgi:hypothetical protein